jgi:hypothetical protein
MCTLLVGIDRPGPGRLLLGANRDEAVDRPALPPALLPTVPPVVAGRDALAGGTWLGLQPGRLVAAVLNRPPAGGAGEGGAAAPGTVPAAGAGAGGPPERSRGLLCLDALAAPSAAAARVRLRAELAARRYAPFTLFVADAHEAWAAAWDGTFRVLPLGPGWHVLTHVDPDDPRDPRTALALAALAAHPPQDADALVPLLASHDGARAICLHAERHGTVSSTLLDVTWRAGGDTPGGRGGARYLHAPGRPCVTPYAGVAYREGT